MFASCSHARGLVHVDYNRNVLGAFIFFVINNLPESFALRLNNCKKGGIRVLARSVRQKLVAQQGRAFLGDFFHRICEEIRLGVWWRGLSVPCCSKGIF